MGKFFKRIIIVGIVLGLFYFCFGFFIVRPMGVLNEGSTILYFRLGLNGKFLTSADAILSDDDEAVVGRLVGLAKYGKKVNERKVASFPYSEALYLLSRAK